MDKTITSIFKKYKHNFTTRVFEKDVPILTQGNRLDYIYILKEGTVKLCHSDFVGSTYLIDIESSESIFGEIEALQDKSIGTTIIPLTTCKTLEINKADFLEIIQKDLDVALALNYKFSARMYQSWSREMRQVTLPLKYRVLYFLINIEKKNLDIPITKNLLVEGVGSNIRSVNRVLKELTNENLIVIKNSLISIPSLSVLEDYFDNLI